MVSLRKFPYPYKAALSISNDIDCTTFEDFLEMHKFLNTGRETSMGPGLGLEIGDSFWMYSACHEYGDAFSYFNGTSLEPSEYAETMRKLITAGFLDCLHSYGNFNQLGGFKREMAVQAIKELEKRNLKVDVWVNHGDIHNFQNMGDSETLGDALLIPTADGTSLKVFEYHSDITIAYGIRFLWKSDLTNVIGQDCPLSLREKSERWLKFQIATKLLKRKREPDTNELVRIKKLRDGSLIYTFQKFGTWQKGTSIDLPEILSCDNLNKLKKKKACSVIYVHLGKRNRQEAHLLSDPAQQALRVLAEENKKGEIYVTTTSRLLNYNVIQKSLKWHYSSLDGSTAVVIDKVADKIRGDYLPTENQISGITFYIPDTEKTRVFIGPREVVNIQRNPKDYTGKTSISIPLIPMHYPL